jgi:FixJ family two-component response regulator
MTQRATVYVLSDDDAVRDSLDALLQANGIPVRTYDSPAAVSQDLPTDGCLLINLHKRNSRPIELLSQFRSRGFSLPTIILAEQVSRVGAKNVVILQSPVPADKLVLAVKYSLAKWS